MDDALQMLAGQLGQFQQPAKKMIEQAET